MGFYDVKCTLFEFNESMIGDFYLGFFSKYNSGPFIV